MAQIILSTLQDLIIDSFLKYKVMKSQSIYISTIYANYIATFTS